MSSTTNKTSQSTSIAVSKTGGYPT